MKKTLDLNRIRILHNTIQVYAWGSHTAIPKLLGRPPGGHPQAELWMGAHPKAPSCVQIGSEQVPLDVLIRRNAEAMLGPQTAGRFDRRLPYLFKVLAARKPLSIQAHPSTDQAARGFERENRFGIPLQDPRRNYRDPNHKPEIICALTPFWALKGFRPIRDIVHRMERLCPRTFARQCSALRRSGSAEGLKEFFHQLWTAAPAVQKNIVQEALQRSKPEAKEDPVCRWIHRLHQEYADDIGVLAPALLHLVRLKPYQALFLPAGELHAYLEGTGIELMANSDNVLRGGLTPKHVDVEELLRVLDFETRPLVIREPQWINPMEAFFDTPTPEFVLTMLCCDPQRFWESPSARSFEILLCTNGRGEIKDLSATTILTFNQGDVMMVPAAAPPYRIYGNAMLFKAGVPIRSAPAPGGPK